MAATKATRKEREIGRANPPAKQESQPRIEALAYQLWLERGAPMGSPQTDWFEAELLLAGKKRREA